MLQSICKEKIKALKAAFANAEAKYPKLNLVAVMPSCVYLKYRYG
jgi:hypothetical protein